VEALFLDFAPHPPPLPRGERKGGGEFQISFSGNIPYFSLTWHGRRFVIQAAGVHNREDILFGKSPLPLSFDKLGMASLVEPLPKEGNFFPFAKLPTPDLF